MPDSQSTPTPTTPHLRRLSITGLCPASFPDAVQPIDEDQMSPMIDGRRPPETLLPMAATATSFAN